ncbi:MAG: potassium transporter [Cyclobacteriaceae bacterium]
MAKLASRIRETGFGSKGFENSDRLINKDGRFNVIRSGGGIATFSLYHWLINISWTGFFVFVISSYAFVNFVFASIYFMIGSDQLSDTSASNAFWECFFFSTQTLTTVGYGRISPIGNTAGLVASFEAMIGLLGFAFATGLMYGRFSKARSKIFFSRCALVSPYENINGLMVRAANSRKNQLIEMSAKMLYSRLDFSGPEPKRKYQQLNLEIDFITMFPMPWTIVHPINEESPLFNKSPRDLANEKAEFILILKGLDDTFNQFVNQITSYKYDEVAFGRKFLPMYDPAYEKSPMVYLDKIDRCEQAELNLG